MKRKNLKYWKSIHIKSKIYYGFIECIFMNISKNIVNIIGGLDDLLD